MPELGDFQRWFIADEDGSYNARALAEKSRDFYDGKQWQADEAAQLQARGQMAVVYNRVKRKIDYLTGLEKQLRTDAKALNRTPTDAEKDAEAVTDAIRFVLHNNSFDPERSDAFEDFLIEGVLGFEVSVSGGKEPDILVNRIPFDRLFYDQHSRKRDFSDAHHLGIVVWMDLEFAKAMYPGKSMDLDNMFSGSGGSETYDDIPRERFVDAARRRVRVLHMYYKMPAKNKKGFDWYYVEFAHGVILKAPKKSVFTDDEGLTVAGYEFQSAFVNRDGERYGLVAEMLDPQREVNARRSKALHLQSVRQTAAVEGAVEDEDELRRQLAKVDGHVTVNPGFWDQWRVLDTRDQAQAHFNLLQEAKTEIDSIGPNVFLQGTDSAVDASGRALQSRQQAQLTGLGGLFDGLRQAQRRVYEQVWYRVRQFWTTEKWIRVTDDENNIKFAMLNKTRRQLLKEQGVEIAINRDGSLAPIDTATDPRLNERVGADVSRMHVDFILEDVPDVATIQQEQFQVLADLYRVNPQEVDFLDLIELSALRNKDKILKRKRGEDMSPEDQQRMQAMEQQRQIANAEQIANIENTQADTQKKVAEASKAQQAALKDAQNTMRTAQLPVRG